MKNEHQCLKLHLQDAKHAKVGAARLSVRFDAGWLAIAVSDEGCGFDRLQTRPSQAVDQLYLDRRGDLDLLVLQSVARTDFDNFYFAG